MPLQKRHTPCRFSRLNPDSAGAGLADVDICTCGPHGLRALCDWEREKPDQRRGHPRGGVWCELLWERGK